MKTLSATFAVLCVSVPVVYASSQTTVQEDYVWQDRFNERFQAAQSGNAEAQFNIGEMFEKGSGVSIDLERAFIWYERAAKQNHPKARFKLAYMYYRGEGTEPNPGKAFQMMEALAKGGYARAQYYLGVMYESGIATARNVDQAALWYHRAAAGGYTMAQVAVTELEKLAPKFALAEAASTVQAMNPAPTAALPGEAARGAQEIPSTQSETPASPLLSTEPEVATVASAHPAIQVLPTTYSLLVNGNWVVQSSRPVEFLPSSVTSCEHSGEADLECLSKEIISNVANAEIVYQTRATVSAIQPSGEFKVTYRNNVVKILRDLDPDNVVDRSQAGMNIGLGWQETEHHLDCRLENGQTIQCVKNQTQNLTIKNQAAL